MNYLKKPCSNPGRPDRDTQVIKITDRMFSEPAPVIG